MLVWGWFVAEVKKQNVSKVILERLRALDDLPHFPDALMKLEQILVSDPSWNDGCPDNGACWAVNCGQGAYL